MSDVLASTRPGFRMARLKVNAKGKYSQWRKGELVRAWPNENDGKYLIERVKWRGSLVPLTNQCANIVAAMLDFENVPAPPPDPNAPARYHVPKDKHPPYKLR